MTAVDRLEAELAELKASGKFEPTVAGNTHRVYTKKQRAAIVKREKKRKDDLAAWNKKPDKKVRVLRSIGGMHLGHPEHKTFAGGKGDIIEVKADTAKDLIRAGHAENV
jgi:hypothetical protein